MNTVKVLMLLILPLSTFLHSQITLTRTHVSPFFTPGITHPGYGMYDSSFNVGTASSSAQTWNFGSRVIADTVQRQLLHPGQVVRNENFPQSTVVDFHYDDAPANDTCTHYLFYSLSDNDLLLVGEVKDGPCDNNPTATRHWHRTPSQTWLKLPVTYGTAWVSTDTAVTEFYTRITTVTNTIDAYGTIILPFGSFNTLRWKKEEVRAEYQNGMFKHRDKSISFSWLTGNNIMFEIQLADTAKTSGSVPTRGGGVYVSNSPNSIADNFPRHPNGYRLLQNYPNPFNPVTSIPFTIPKPEFVSLTIYDLLGKEIEILVSRQMNPGNYSVNWSGNNSPSGVYYYQLRAGEYRETKKLTLVK